MPHAPARDRMAATPAPLDYALVRAGGQYCLLPHRDGGSAPGQPPVSLWRVAPWRPPTPIPGTPPSLVLGVAPLADEEGIERVEVVLDLATALGLAVSATRGASACVLLYRFGDLSAGLAVDALVRRVRTAPPAQGSGLPFTRGLMPPMGEPINADDAAEAWRVVDVPGLLRHVAATLQAPELTR